MRAEELSAFQRSMHIIGLTGSIGMGKTAVAQLFRNAGIPVHDSDALIHRLYSGLAVPLIETAFPGTTQDGSVNRGRLAARVLVDPVELRKLESIVHPLAAEDRAAFLAGQTRLAQKLVVLDIPLLFESGMVAIVNTIVVVSAPAQMQRLRVCNRPGMTTEKFERILAQQMPDAAKRRGADFIIPTGGNLSETRSRVLELIARCAEIQDEGLDA